MISQSLISKAQVFPFQQSINDIAKFRLYFEQFQRQIDQRQSVDESEPSGIKPLNMRKHYLGVGCRREVIKGRKSSGLDKFTQRIIKQYKIKISKKQDFAKCRQNISNKIQMLKRGIRRQTIRMASFERPQSQQPTLRAPIKLQYAEHHIPSAVQNFISASKQVGKQSHQTRFSTTLNTKWAHAMSKITYCQNLHCQALEAHHHGLIRTVSVSGRQIYPPHLKRLDKQKHKKLAVSDSMNTFMKSCTAQDFYSIAGKIQIEKSRFM